MAKQFRPFLGFTYRDQNWRFRVMPFGLNLAPRIFTKIISYVVHRLSLEGIWCLPYLDDLLIIAMSEEECLTKLQKSLEIIQKLGWIINMEKSRIVPQQAFEWLGVEYNTRSYTVRNTTKMCQRFNTSILLMSKSPEVTKREIMSIQGTANWMGQVDFLKRTVISDSRRLLRTLRTTALDTSLLVTATLKIAVARWIKLPNLVIPLGIPTTISIQADASLKGYGFLIN